MKKKFAIVVITDLLILILLFLWINLKSERTFYENKIIWTLLLFNIVIGFILIKTSQKEMVKVIFINSLLVITVFHYLFIYYLKNYDKIHYDDRHFKYDGLDYDLRIEKDSDRFYCTEKIKETPGIAVSVLGGNYKKLDDTIYLIRDSSETWTLYKNKLTGFFKHSDTISVISNKDY